MREPSARSAPPTISVKTRTDQLGRPISQRLLSAAWPHYLFIAGVLLKGLDGVLEFISGFLLLVVSPHHLNHLIEQVTQGELAQDPHDWLANAIVAVGHHLTSDAKIFVACYLLAHGVVKLFLVVCLLKHKWWAYPLTIVLLLGMVGYQIYRVSHLWSWWLLVLTVSDIIIIALIALEYWRVKPRKKKKH